MVVAEVEGAGAGGAHPLAGSRARIQRKDFCGGLSLRRRPTATLLELESEQNVSHDDVSSTRFVRAQVPIPGVCNRVRYFDLWPHGRYSYSPGLRPSAF